VHIDNADFLKLVRQIPVGFVDLRIVREIAGFAPRRESNCRALRTDGIREAASHFEDETGTFRYASSVRVVPLVRSWIEELLEQIPIRAVQLHTVEARLNCEPSTVYEFIPNLAQLFEPQRAWRTIRLELRLIGPHLTGGGNG